MYGSEKVKWLNGLVIMKRRPICKTKRYCLIINGQTI